eukprot:gene11123-20003_t
MLLSGDALDTAQFIAKVDQIFDCCNSLSFKDSKFCRRPFTEDSQHMEVMISGIHLFKSIKVINPGTGQDRTASIKCLKGWCFTLSAIIALWEQLHHNEAVSFLVTRQLNQDPLENLFGSIRQQGGNADNPTPIQFKRAYRKLFHTNLLSVVTGNCEPDNNEPLTKLASLEGIATPLTNELLSIAPLKLKATDFATETMQNKVIRQNAITYVAGYLLHKAFAKHKCPKCSILVDDSIDTSTSTFLFFKAYDRESSMFGGLIAPSQDMILYTTMIEDKFVDYFNTLNKTVGICHELLTCLNQAELNVPCGNFDKDYLLRLFIRMRIYYTLKFANQDLAAPTSKKKNRKFVKVAHL